MPYDSDCGICRRLELIRKGDYPQLVHEFEHSVLIVGDHQYFKGYCVLLLKEHFREVHEMPGDMQSALFRELMASTQAVVSCYQPWKMNHACLGNVDQHVHWHLFPRYESDPDHKNHPFLHAAKFPCHAITPEQARSIAAVLKTHVK